MWVMSDEDFVFIYPRLLSLLAWSKVADQPALPLVQFYSYFMAQSH